MLHGLHKKNLSHLPGDTWNAGLPSEMNYSVMWRADLAMWSTWTTFLYGEMSASLRNLSHPKVKMWLDLRNHVLKMPAVSPLAIRMPGSDAASTLRQDKTHWSCSASEHWYAGVLSPRGGQAAAPLMENLLSGFCRAMFRSHLASEINDALQLWLSGKPKVYSSQRLCPILFL